MSTTIRARLGVVRRWLRAARESRNLGVAVGLCVAAALALAACGGDDGDSNGSGSDSSGSGGETTKVAAVLAGPKNDHSSNEAVAKGVTEAAAEASVPVGITESVSPANAPQVLQSLAQDGYGIIVAMGAEFLQPVEQVAQGAPDTDFIVMYGGPTSVPNVLSAVADPYAMSYVAGVAGGSMTETDQLGLVSGENSQTFQQVIEGFTNGAKSVDPSADVRHAYSGDYSDVIKNTEAAQALIDGGADVLLGYLDAGQAPLDKTAAKNGKYAVGYIADMQSIAPTAVIVSALTGEGEIAKKVVLAAEQGKFEGGRQQVFGPRQGVGELGAFGSFVSPEVQSTVKAAYDGIASGKINPKSP